MTILGGDIGGTNSRLALFDEDGTRLAESPERVYPSREHRGLADVVHRFLDETGSRPTAACVGVAGPVRQGRAVATNLPWVVDATELSRVLRGRAWVINDLEATGWGIGALPAAAFAELAAGDPAAVGNGAVIAAGTGLGEAGLYWDGRHHRPFASEGGHASFAPHGPLEAELLVWLRRRFPQHVSWERVVSGPGLVALYEFLRDTGRGDEPASLRDEMRSGDPGAAVSAAALDGTSDLASQALDLFVALYGAEAGNLALKVMATGGVHLAGGIAPRILPRLRSGPFVARFLAKGRMRPLLEAMPVRVVTDDRCGLHGAGRCAAVLVRGG